MGQLKSRGLQEGALGIEIGQILKISSRVVVLSGESGEKQPVVGDGGVAPHGKVGNIWRQLWLSQLKVVPVAPLLVEARDAAKHPRKDRQSPGTAISSQKCQ